MKIAIYLPLGVLLICAFIVLIFGNSFSFYSSESSIESISVINGTITIKEVEYGLNFGISIQEGILSLIIGITAVVVLLGLTVLGTGLNDETVRIVSTITIYIALWTFFSTFTYDLFLLVDYLWTVYWFFTFLYAFGVISKITGGNA